MAIVLEDSSRGLALRSATGRLALVATVAASGMASLDATVVNVALRTVDVLALSVREIA